MLDEFGRGSRTDLIVEVYQAAGDAELDSLVDVVMFESKVGSVEGKDQLKRCAGHLTDLSGARKTLVYITRAYDPKNKEVILSNVNGVCFEQLRWHDFYRFLRTVAKDALVEEVMLFMEEQGMAQSHRFSTADLLTLSRVPRAFEIFDETLGDDVRAELEAFAGNKVRGQTHSLSQIRRLWRFVIIAPLQDWDLFCFVGYSMDDPQEHPGLTVNLESKPNAVARETSVAAMRRVAGRGDWEAYNLDSSSEWAGVSRWLSLADLLSEEDHVAAVKRYFVESIRQLRVELAAFTKEHLGLPWNGGESA